MWITTFSWVSMSLSPLPSHPTCFFHDKLRVALQKNTSFVKATYTLQRIRLLYILATRLQKQGMNINRVKNDRNMSESPTLLSCKQGPSEREKIHINKWYHILNFHTMFPHLHYPMFIHYSEQIGCLFVSLKYKQFIS